MNSNFQILSFVVRILFLYFPQDKNLGWSFKFLSSPRYQYKIDITHFNPFKNSSLMYQQCTFISQNVLQYENGIDSREWVSLLQLECLKTASPRITQNPESSYQRTRSSIQSPHIHPNSPLEPRRSPAQGFHLIHSEPPKSSPLPSNFLLAFQLPGFPRRILISASSRFQLR